MISYSPTDEEYELQFYQFSAGDFINHFKHLICREITSVFDEYINIVKITQNMENVSKLEEFKSEIELLCKRKVEEELKLAEDTIKHFLAIPKSVLLLSDKSQRRQYTAKEVNKLENEVKYLQKECLKEQLMIHLCKSEIEILHKIDGCKNILENYILKVSQLDTTNFKELMTLLLNYQEHSGFKISEGS